MKFWEKFWKLVSKKDLVFVTLIFVAVIVFSFLESGNKVKVEFTDVSVNAVSSTKYSLDIPYDLVEYIELADIAERGESEKGRDDMVTRTGFWKNDTWGEYYACIDLQTSKCIVVHLDDGRIFVFSRKNDEETSAIFETFQGHLDGLKN